MANAKKDATSKNTNSSAHPPYLQMISEAITTMKDRSGSSHPSIAKFIEENHANQLPPNFRKLLSVQLKRFVKSEKLIKVKNSYKLPVAEKVKRQPATKITYTETVEKSQKTKRLSLVKTPEALKKKPAAPKIGAKTKNNTPKKRKAGRKSASSGSDPPAKKAKN